MHVRTILLFAVGSLTLNAQQFSPLVAPAGTYACGFVPPATVANGADFGACYFADARGCTNLSAAASVAAPGRSCMEQGGIFVPQQACQTTRPSNVNFSNTNAYYVWDPVINNSDGTVTRIPTTDPRARTYSPTVITDAAINWINSQSSGKPWMVSVTYPSIHDPYQQAPDALSGVANSSALQCQKAADQRVLSNQMAQAMDTEIGRLLVQTGLASRRDDGTLQYTPEATNTMIIIIGDNGSYAPVVKAPFDPTRAKGYVYQTGVWVPLIIAGPAVNSPDRDVEHMVNVSDLFEPFGDLAGIDVRQVVPRRHVLDSVPMLPYLRDPQQPSI